MEAFPFQLRVLGNVVFAQKLGAAAHVPDAHGGGAGDALEFSEAVHLHGAGKDINTLDTTFRLWGISPAAASITISNASTICRQWSLPRPLQSSRTHSLR